MRAAWLVLVTLLALSCQSTSARAPVVSGSRVGSPVASPTAVTLYCGDAASGARTLSPGPTPPSPNPADDGSISGALSFPSEILPAQLVYAINTAGVAHGAAAVETVFGQGTYVLAGLPPGSYHVYSVTRYFAGTLPQCATWGAIYSRAVPCGLTVGCKDHSPLAVTVRSGQTVQRVDPVDWYTDPGDPSFQAPPASIVKARSYVPTYGAFSSPRDAANDFALGRSVAMLVTDQGACPTNRACVVVGTQVNGTDAAYFLGAAGSNGSTRNCATYVYRSKGSWHGLDWRCGNDHVFPTIGQSGRVVIGLGANPTDCVNVRAGAGLASKVVGCVREGSIVAVDAGPSFAPGKDIDGLWWHVAGKGWMSDNFLYWPPPAPPPA